MRKSIIAAAIAVIVVLSGCSSPTGYGVPESIPKRIVESSSPTELSEEARVKAQELDAWLMRVNHYEFPENVLSGKNAASELHDLATGYPLPDSEVSAALNRAADLINAGVEQLDARAYEDGAKSLSRAAEEVASTSELVMDDVAIVESSTGYRISGEGELAMTGIGEESGTIKEWIDGDTLRLTSGETVRLIGIDTPEMSEKCSQAEEALAAAKQLAPKWSRVTLGTPDTYDYNATDKYGRELRYVILEDGTDVGYSLLLNDLATPRYDSRDGFRWHTHEKAYRDTKAKPGFDAACTFAAVGLTTLADEDDDNDITDSERSRIARLDDIAMKLSTANKSLSAVVAHARETHTREDEWESQPPSISNDDESVDVPDGLCPTRWC